MKHTKMFFALVVLAAAVLVFGCNQAATPSSSNSNTGGNSGGGSSGGFTMNAAQKAAYESWIAGAVQQAATREIPASEVSQAVQGSNTGFASLGFKVVDTKADQPIAQGTTADALKARFKAEAVSGGGSPTPGPGLQIPSVPAGLTLIITPLMDNPEADGEYIISGVAAEQPYNQNGKFKIEGNEQGPTGMRLINTMVNGQPDNSMDTSYPFTDGMKVSIKGFTFDLSPMFEQPQP